MPSLAASTKKLSAASFTLSIREVPDPVVFCIGGIPDSSELFACFNFIPMKTNQERKALTLGDLIESGYRACGKRRASAIIRLATRIRLIVFQGHGGFLIS